MLISRTLEAFSPLESVNQAEGNEEASLRIEKTPEKVNLAKAEELIFPI